jgi:activating signal cointegrator 1
MIKALTISQPYASLIASGEKWIENRIWYTAHRGQLAIHAGRGLQYVTRQELLNYPHGCIIATCKLTGCVSQTNILANMKDETSKNRVVPGTTKTWKQVFEHKYTEGFYCWIIEDVQKLETPVVIRGAQGLWNWDGDQ